MSPLEAAIARAKSINTGKPFLVSTICGMLTGYDAKWSGLQHEIELLEVEKTYFSDLPNLHTNGKSRTFRLAGIVDKVGRRDGITIYDHKTTTSDIEDPYATYWRQLEIEGQPSQYELLLHANGIEVDRVVWDVARKPTIKPKGVAKKEVAALASAGRYCGREFDSSIAVEGMRETPEMFEARVAQQCVDQPHRFFQRRGVKRTREELTEYVGELWDIGQEIIAARRGSRWYRNSGSCMQYGSPCEFLGICSGYDSVDSDRWVDKGCVHEELDVNGDGRDLLTNSRVRCYQTCRRKHFYKYELGIKRADEEEREPLFFGSLWHDCLDVYWNASFSEVNDGCYSGTPANEVVGPVVGPVSGESQGLPF